MLNNLIRRPAVSTRLGIKPSTTYNHISRGLIPRGVQIGPRAVAWQASEIESIAAARIAGKSEAEIKALVVSLTAARQITPDRADQLERQRESTDARCRAGVIQALSKA